MSIDEYETDTLAKTQKVPYRKVLRGLRCSHGAVSSRLEIGINVPKMLEKWQ